MAGDDLYNANTEGNIFDIIKLEPGAKWSVLDDDKKIIDDWYHDDEGKDNRWKPETAKNNTATVLSRGAALKAAHGINAPTPSPTPALGLGRTDCRPYRSTHGSAYNSTCRQHRNGCSRHPAPTARPRCDCHARAHRAGIRCCPPDG